MQYINSSELYVLIDYLYPYTEYEFQVRVTKGQRQSEWSMVAYNTTLEDGKQKIIIVTLYKGKRCRGGQLCQ